ncbi:MAG: hypothetical protein LBG61_06755 [Burkholderiales bacterium]|jgi:hypothetical protein|nr:hypothetical protein [Burkholderiales bacterium]
MRKTNELMDIFDRHSLQPFAPNIIDDVNPEEWDVIRSELTKREKVITSFCKEESIKKEPKKEQHFNFFTGVIVGALLTCLFGSFLGNEQ